MGDNDDVVAWGRPVFDVEFHGLHRVQVLEHIALLEDQLRRATRDRDAAIELNTDLRRMYDETQRGLTKVTQRLNDVHSGGTALPAASQQVRNMLAAAEEEGHQLQEHAKQQAKRLCAAAMARARQLVDEARRDVRAMRHQCTDLIADIETRHEQLHREHTEQLRALKQHEERMRHAIRHAYKTSLANAQQQANALLERARRDSAQTEATTERLCANAREELDAEHAKLEAIWQAALPNVADRKTRGRNRAKP